MAIKIYLDGAGLADMERLIGQCDGLTTNPSLLRKAGITDYHEFAQEVLEIADGKPVSFEVLADEWEEIYRQAHIIAAWGDNCFVKIPIMTTNGTSNVPLIAKLAHLKLNITAVFTTKQINDLRPVVTKNHIVSVFAGRILDADGGVPRIRRLAAQALWASTRQTHDLTTAHILGYSIITMTADLIAKLPLRGKDLHEYSRETVQQFVKDAAGLRL